MAKESYVTKLLTLLVSRAENQTIKIPASELFSQEVGQGITVYWDEKSKSLVLTFLPSGAKTYTIMENSTWLGKQESLSPVSSEPQPLSREEMLSKVWTESAATSTTAELAAQSRQRKDRKTVIHLTDEDLSLAELERRKREALREIDNYQSPPQPIPPSGKRTTFYKQ